MKFHLFLILAVAMSLFSTAALAADVNGKWTAEMKTPDGETRTSTYTFKADGGKLTGTIASQMGEREISEGKVDGDNISFVVSFERDGNTFKITYTGVVSGDALKLKMTTPRGEREITAKRSTT
jgi:opacity protein-like surface antigen